jgi:DNA-binding LytR/AlgR family response regulator
MTDRVLRVIIVDDESPARSLLRLLCAETGVEVVGDAADGTAAIALVETMACDVVLLDIGMPGMGGMEVARELKQRPGGPVIIFTTAYAEYAVSAFDVGAVDYLLKPIDPARLSVAFERARSACAIPAPPTSDHIWVPYRADLRRIALDAIERVEAERDYVRLYTAGEFYLLRATMDGIEKRLPPGSFLRIHRSTILRRDMICGLKSEGAGIWSVILPDTSTSRIGRSYFDAVKAM